MRLRAVVLDEDPLVRQLLYAVLDTRGYEVFTFPHPGVCPIHMADRCLCPSAPSVPMLLFLACICPM